MRENWGTGGGGVSGVFVFNKLFYSVLYKYRIFSDLRDPKIWKKRGAVRHFCGHLSRPREKKFRIFAIVSQRVGEKV